MTASAECVVAELDLPGIRQAVEAELRTFLRGKIAAAADERLPDVIPRALHDFVLAGGKRLRPLLCVLGWHAAHGDADPRPVIRVAAALELFHAFALIHDDLMDSSAIRRGRPTMHRALADHHRAGPAQGDSDRFGANAAILAGDLALAWSHELLHTAGLSSRRLTAVLPVVDAMRTELMYGQCLDLLSTGRLAGDVEEALQVVRYKTAKYTCERPLHVGALLADADPTTLAACSAVALPLGEAFQLRDDLLGAYGRSETTGKSALEDFREGKHTVLLTLALRHTDERQRATLRALIGDRALTDAGAARIRTILTATGARDEIEHMIADRLSQALRALDAAPFRTTTITALRRLAGSMTTRTS
ncbi:MAG: polyprenyl synthetase family protein [Streptomyces sp.]|nr:polyprenyl synthetase family protein [Streptomyces sp.]